MRASSAIFLTTSVLASSVSLAADLKQAKFTQVVNDVRILEAATKQTKKANQNDVFKMPDMIRTGPASRAELVAEDKTITRIGANSIFSYDQSNRTVNLEKGSVLFQAPKGKGGGTIRTTSAAASVLGTTMIVSATEDGGFKVLLLEGSGRITLPNGRSVVLKPGQMVFVLPNGGGFSPVVTFKLEDQVEGSLLVNGFNTELPSMDLIELEITRQNELLANGQAVDTGLLATDIATSRGIQTVDPSVLQDYFESQTPHTPPDNQPEPPPPVPTLFDVIIHDTLADQRIIDTEGASLIRGRNILIDGTAVDTTVVNSSELLIQATGIMEFRSPDNETYFDTDFILPVRPGLAAAVEGGGPGYLFLAANEFRFPNSYFLGFNGYELALHSFSDLSLRSTDIERGLRIENSNEYGYGRVSLYAERNINLQGNVRLYGSQLNLEAQNNLTMNGGYLGFTYSAELDAGNVLNLKSVGFGLSQQFMAMSAKTIVLENVSFNGGSQVYLRSQFGQLAADPNTGKAVQPGYVNFIRNVTYNGDPAQNYIGNGIYISSLNSSNLANKVKANQPASNTPAPRPATVASPKPPTTAHVSLIRGAAQAPAPKQSYAPNNLINSVVNNSRSSTLRN